MSSPRLPMSIPDANDPMVENKEEKRPPPAITTLRMQGEALNSLGTEIKRSANKSKKEKHKTIAKISSVVLLGVLVGLGVTRLFVALEQSKLKSRCPADILVPDVCTSTARIYNLTSRCSNETIADWCHHLNGIHRFDTAAMPIMIVATLLFFACALSLVCKRIHVPLERVPVDRFEAVNALLDSKTHVPSDTSETTLGVVRKRSQDITSQLQYKKETQSIINTFFGSKNFIQPIISLIHEYADCEEKRFIDRNIVFPSSNAMKEKNHSKD